jgi:hypothetical protein
MRRMALLPVDDVITMDAKVGALNNGGWIFGK